MLAGRLDKVEFANDKGKEVSAHDRAVEEPDPFFPSSLRGHLCLWHVRQSRQVLVDNQGDLRSVARRGVAVGSG